MPSESQNLSALERLRAEVVRLGLTDAVDAAVAAAPPVKPEVATAIADLLMPAVLRRQAASAAVRQPAARPSEPAKTI